MDRARFEELYQAFQEAEGARKAHWETLSRAYRFADAAWEDTGGSRTWDDAWREEYRTLNATRDEAEERLTAFLRGEA